MKAVRWHGRGDVRVEDIPEPSLAPHEVMVEVVFSGICGSEVHEYESGPIFIPLDPHPLTGKCAPQTLGHEFGGRIVDVGAEVRDLQVGDMVSVNPIQACGKCSSCQRGRPSLCRTLAYYGAIGDGGHAQLAAIDAANCVKFPSDVTAEHLALGEPAGVAYHAALRGGIGPGSSVVVIGGGPIGQLAAQYARQLGATKVFLSEVAPTRMALAEQVGAVDEVFDPVDVDLVEQILARTDGDGADVVLECSGGSQRGLLKDTAVEAIELTRPEGTAVIVGTFTSPSSVQMNDLVLMERRLIGSWTWHGNEFREALEMIVDGRVKVMPLITSRIPLADTVSRGIRELQTNRDEHVKILVQVR